MCSIKLLKFRLLNSSIVAVLVMAVLPVSAALALQDDEAALLDRIDSLEDSLAEEKALRLEQASYFERVLREQEARLEQIEARAAAISSASSVSLPLAEGPDPRIPHRIHEVGEGETIAEIARLYNAEAAYLRRANGIQADIPLAAGTEIFVPVGGQSRMAVVANGATGPIQSQGGAQSQGATQSDGQISLPQVTPEQRREAEARIAEQEAIRQRDARERLAQQQATQQQVEEQQAARQRATQRQSDPDQAPDSAPEQVGQRPTEEYEEPQINILSDVGGVLSPKGAFYYETSVGYSVSSDNRFFFNGVEIIDALLVGIINATDTDRQSITFTNGLRYGLTDRIEFDITVPLVYQDDRIQGVQIDDGTNVLTDLEGSGIGDVAFGAHWQMNDGRRLPYLIANIRAKAPTGRGPLEIDFDENGLAAESPTGSGFWSIEPSLTFIQPSSPAVLFGNIGYQFNLEEDIDSLVGDTAYVDFDPGDTIRTSFGIGLSLNEKTSMSFAYDQSYILGSSYVIDPTGDLADPSAYVTTDGQETTIGSFLFGLSHNPTDKIGLSLNTTLGATDEAPDASLNVRARVRLD